MATHDRPAEATDISGPVPPEMPTPGRLPFTPTGRAWALVIVAGIVAGVGSWLATEAILKAYKATFVKGPGPYPTPEEARQYLWINILGGTAALAATGGILGLALGIAGGACRPSLKAALGAGVLGLVAGAVAEGGAARLVVWYYYTRVEGQTDDLIMPIVCHLATWAVIGAAGGLAFGAGLGGPRRWLRTMIGGAVAGSLAILAYDVLGAVALSTHGTHLPQADTAEARALAQVLVCVATGFGAVLAARPPKVKPART